MWAEFKDKTGDIYSPDNYIQGSLQSEKPDKQQIGAYWEENHPNWMQVPDNYIPPATSKDIEVVRAEKVAEINNACAKVITSGFYSSALGEKHRYDSDIVDQINFMQAYDMAKVTGKPVPYRIWNTDDVTKDFHPHTAAQFETAYQDGAVMKATALAVCANKKALIALAKTVEEVEAITWDSVDTESGQSTTSEDGK